MQKIVTSVVFSAGMLLTGVGFVFSIGNASAEPAPDVSTQPSTPVDTAKQPSTPSKYVFTADYFSYQRPLWEKLLTPYRGRPNLSYLEIGVNEGRATMWMLDNVLTHPTARATSLDIFPGDLQQRFEKNVRASGASKKVKVMKGRSQDTLKLLDYNSFDIIYIDGSHNARDVLADAVLVWPLLKEGGLLIFDDYEWEPSWAPTMRPQLAVDSFVAANADFLEVVHKGYQFIVRKKKDYCVGDEAWQCSLLGDYRYYWEYKKLLSNKDGHTVQLSEDEHRNLRAYLASRGVPASAPRQPYDQAKITALFARLGVSET